MRRHSLLVATSLAVVVPLVAHGPAEAKPAKPAANLLARHVTGSMSAGKVVASATVKNRGARTARRSQTTFLLSKDGAVSADDKVLGRVQTDKVKAKKSKPASGTFPVPASAADGAYRVIACTDTGGRVPERREGDNCKASKRTLTVVRHVTITWAVTGGVPQLQEGAVTATATGGSCTAAGPTGSCTVSTGASTVTLTAGGEIPLALNFNSWAAASPGSCVGVTTGAKNEILTGSNPTADQTCVAGYRFAV